MLTNPARQSIALGVSRGRSQHFTAASHPVHPISKTACAIVWSNYYPGTNAQHTPRHRFFGGLLAQSLSRTVSGRVSFVFN